MPSLAVIGNLALDVVDGRPPRPGGGPYYAARALRALGRPAVVVTKCAEEDRRRLLRPLAALGVPVCWHAASATAVFGIRYTNGDRSLEVEQPGDPWTVGDVRSWASGALEGVGWLQVAPLGRPDFPPDTLAELARGGRRLLLDGQGLVRPGGHGPVELDAAFDPAALDHLAVLKLAEEEAEVLLGGTDAGRIASLGVPEVVVTLGERGALVWAGGDLTPLPTRPVRGRVDPTGAGDAFAAAYLSSRASGDPPAAAGRRACALVASLLSGRS